MSGVLLLTMGGIVGVQLWGAELDDGVEVGDGRLWGGEGVQRGNPLGRNTQ